MTGDDKLRSVVVATPVLAITRLIREGSFMRYLRVAARSLVCVIGIAISAASAYGQNIPAPVVLANWEFVERRDAMTDELVREARTRNLAGFELRVFRMASGKVYALFRLPDASTDVLSATRYPMYRIDQHKPQDLENDRVLARVLNERPIFEEPKWVQFLVWHGSDPYPTSGTLFDLMHGQRIVFRYYLFTGGYKETEFSLDGAHDAVVRALGLIPPGESHQ